jgi:hypothetical protein
MQEKLEKLLLLLSLGKIASEGLKEGLTLLSV